ncbi:MAG: clostripain-related cysteine peptidase [candidate division WOR-3 bacterium]
MTRIFLFLLVFGLLTATEWTVIFYLDGDNGLSQAAASLLESISRFGRNPNIKIVALIDYLSFPPAVYEIVSGEKHLKVSLPESDLADINFFSEFIAFCRDYYPAQKYILIFYDHGNGWYPEVFPLIQRAVLYDASAGSSVGVAGGELRNFLRKAKEILGKEITIVGFDACLMGEIEVLTEIKDYCQICLASPSLIPIVAWDYEGFLDTLEKNPRISAQDLARVWVELIRKKGREGIYAAYDLSALRKINLKELTEEIKKKGRNLLKAKRRICLTYPMQETPPSPEDCHIDLIHFLEILGVENKLKEIIIGTNQEEILGLGVWFPLAYGEFKRWYLDYLTLQFSKESFWGHFLYYYYGIDDIKPTPVKLAKSTVGAENEFTISWNRSFDFAPVTYHLHSFTSSETILYELGNNLNKWEGDFTIADRSHSPPSSFFSGAGINLNKNLTLKEPIFLPEGGILSFWTYYETEETYANEEIKRDIFYIEVSKDGRNWESIDSIYGQNLTWRFFSYLLPTAESLRLRFRYQTDGTINFLGVFIDDITILSLSNHKRYGWVIRDTSFFISNQPKGIYKFFVIPEDSTGNKGFISEFLVQEIEKPCRPFSYPSPFFSATKIFLDVEDDERGELFIIDLLGRVRRKLPFWGKEVFFDGLDNYRKELSPGVYFLVGKNGKGGKICKVGF